jgi:hypothetical protein
MMTTKLYSQYRLKIPPTEPEHIVRKAEIDAINRRIDAIIARMDACCPNEGYGYDYGYDYDYDYEYGYDCYPPIRPDQWHCLRCGILVIGIPGPWSHCSVCHTGPMCQSCSLNHCRYDYGCDCGCDYNYDYCYEYDYYPPIKSDQWNCPDCGVLVGGIPSPWNYCSICHAGPRCLSCASSHCRHDYCCDYDYEYDGEYEYDCCCCGSPATHRQPARTATYGLPVYTVTLEAIDP